MNEFNANQAQAFMKCPFCKHKDSKVVDSRSSGNSGIRRRRVCLKCRRRFTSYEYSEQIRMMVVKKDGRREFFDREKILNGLMKACEKRPISMKKLEDIVFSIERRARKKFEREVESSYIGEKVMEHLASLDEVAYVRFASVYRRFTDLRHFMDELKIMLKKSKAKSILRDKSGR